MNKAITTNLIGGAASGSGNFLALNQIFTFSSMWSQENSRSCPHKTMKTIPWKMEIKLIMKH